MVMPLSISSFTKVTRSIRRASSKACSKEPTWKEKAQQWKSRPKAPQAEAQSSPADLPVLPRHQDVFLGDVGSVPGQSHAQLLCGTGFGAC